MRTIPKWVNKIHEADKVECSSVKAICFSPDGTQLVIGAGEKLMVYNPQDGSLVQLLQAHKGTVNAVAYCLDGNKFASGSSDKNVIIWTSKMEGVVKYSHNEPVQCLAYNPVTYQLASCALCDFAFWSAEVKAVQKYKVSSRITCCAWSSNGHNLAIGLAAGTVTIRDKCGDESHRVIRNAAIWAITFSGSTLLVTDWNDTLSFYNLSGQQLHKERKIGISAMSIAMLGELVVVGGLDGWAILTSEGVPILDTPHEWVWAVALSSSLNTVAIGCQDGTVWCYQIVTSTVHGLYRERYSYRENMTDVIIQHLTNGNKVRIKCHDTVQKIAIYKNRLAVQLPERVVVYEQGDVDGMLYRVKEKLVQNIDCSLLVTTSDSLLLCQEEKLIMIGRRVPKTWEMPAPIRYVKVTTLDCEEVLLLGLSNGQIWEVEPKSGRSKQVLQCSGSVRCVDVSASRAHLAVVDEKCVCRVYSIVDRNQPHVVYTEENVSSVSWNSWCDEMICLSGGGLLSIKASNFSAATQPLAGSVVGFQGGRVFCLQSNAMESINVPLSHAVHQYIQHKMFADAYSVACLGVTALDWERLGYAALEELSLEVARKAFQRSENYVFLTLIDYLQERLESGENRGVVLGEVMAYCGRLSDAARAFKAAGRDDRLLHLYVDLRMFNKAQEMVDEGDAGSAAVLARRRVEWARHMTEPRAAAAMYLAAGDVKGATQLMAETGRTDMLIALARKLDKGSSESLRHVAEALEVAGEYTIAEEVYRRLGDFKKVAQLIVAANEWPRAFAFVREYPECRREVYLPYANKMALENNLVDAQKAYHMAGETSTAMRVLLQLVGNAVSEERYSDAGYLHYLLATQCIELAATATHRDRERHLQRYTENERLARMYHAYESVHGSVHEPFSLNQPDALLNAARYVLALLDELRHPPGISMFCLYLCMAKQAKALNADSLARQMLDKLFKLQVPQKFQESVELLMLKNFAKKSSQGGGDGNSDRHEDLCALCWRCRCHLPVLCALKCTHCAHNIAHSLPSHDVLPLVQFEPSKDITDEEAVALIESTSVPQSGSKEITGNAEVMNLDDDVVADDTPDPFLDKIEEGDDSGVVVCDRQTLTQMNPSSVVVITRLPPLPTLYYRNMLPQLGICVCPHCQHLFYMEDYEIQTVTKGQCPFCRHPAEHINNDEDNVLNGDPSTPPSQTSGDW